MRGTRPGFGMAMSGLGVLALGVLTLGACGTASADLSGPTVTTDGSATASPGSRGGAGTVPQVVSPRGSRGPVFPLTLSRTGGIADYADTVVLEATGKVLVETRHVHGRVCQLAKPEREQLFSLLSTLRRDAGPEATEPGATVPATPESEVIRISLRDSRNELFDLTDPSLGSVSGLVGDLVSDVTLTSPSTVSCTTPPA